MTNGLRIGMIGTDTSHSIQFTKFLNDSEASHRVEGGMVTTAFPGGSPDFPLSYSRVDGFAAELRDRYGVALVDSPEAVAEASDAILLTAVDGRAHRELFRSIAPFGKPVFIDKPFAVSSADAREIIRLAEQHGVPIFSASSIRFMEELELALTSASGAEDIYGADVFGPMSLEETQPGLFWYGIHSVDVLYRLLGAGCEEVHAFANADHDIVVGRWRDGKFGTVRGNRKGNNIFGAALHTPGGTIAIPKQAGQPSKPPYVSLLERIMELFTTGKPAVAPEETLEIIRFIEAANESRTAGKPVALF